MPVVRRGTVYRLTGGSAGLYAVLVLTNDVWNRRMGAVGVVPIRPAAGPGSLWEPVFADQPVLQARVGFLAVLRRSRPLEARFVLAADDLDRVADTRGHLLALPGLCAAPPVPPPPVPGPISYPRCGGLRRQAADRRPGRWRWGAGGTARNAASCPLMPGAACTVPCSWCRRGDLNSHGCTPTTP